MSDALITRHQFHAPRETTDPGEEVNKSHIAPLKRNIILGSRERIGNVTGHDRIRAASRTVFRIAEVEVLPDQFPRFVFTSVLFVNVGLHTTGHDYL